MRPSTSVLAAMATIVLASPPSAGGEETSFGNDLKATIALQGMPCDQVIEAKRNADSDYTAACKDGNRYHIFVNAQGRVIVQKLTP
jgi:hypothetical protein